MKHINDVLTGRATCPYCAEVMVDFAIPLEITIGQPVRGSPSSRHASCEVSLDDRKVERECEKIMKRFGTRLARHIMTCKAVDIVGREMDDWLAKP